MTGLEVGAEIERQSEVFIETKGEPPSTLTLGTEAAKSLLGDNIAIKKYGWAGGWLKLVINNAIGVHGVLVS